MRFSVSLDWVYGKFNKVLLDGFQIAGRLYKFLGFSHSSLRSHAVWNMAGFVDDSGKLRSYITVITELGNFQGIRSPARWYVNDLMPVYHDFLVQYANMTKVSMNCIGRSSREKFQALKRIREKDHTTSTQFDVLTEYIITQVRLESARHFRRHPMLLI
jgi:hypothetical protein